jgi:ABC-type multidrug transport system permease subunit
MCVIAGSGYVLGIITGLLCKNKQIAIQALPLLMMPMITYGGQIVNLSELPWYSSWIQYVTPLRYGFNIIVKNQLQTSELLNLGDDPLILKQLGL